MSYVRQTLAEGETVRLRAKLHWIIWLRAWLALLLLGVVIVGIVIFVRDLIFLTTTEVAITNRRLIRKSGWLNWKTSELELTSIEAVNLEQSFWGRLLGYGRLQVHGTGDDTWLSPAIAAPLEFRKALESALSPAPRPSSASQVA